MRLWVTRTGSGSQVSQFLEARVPEVKGSRVRSTELLGPWVTKVGGQGSQAPEFKVPGIESHGSLGLKGQSLRPLEQVEGTHLRGQMHK